MPPLTLSEITCLYGFEFSRSASTFDKFYEEYFKFVDQSIKTLESELSVMGIAHVAIAMAQHHKTKEEDKEVWIALRKGAARTLGEDRRPLMSTEPI